MRDVGGIGIGALSPGQVQTWTSTKNYSISLPPFLPRVNLTLVNPALKSSRAVRSVKTSRCDYFIFIFIFKGVADSLWNDLIAHLESTNQFRVKDWSLNLRQKNTTQEYILNFIA